MSMVRIVNAITTMVRRTDVSNLDENIKVIRRTYPKEELRELPKATPEGEIVVINDEEEAKKAVAYLKKAKKLGIDSETKPSFKKGTTHKVALLQIADEKRCYLFRLNRFGLTKPVIGLLENKKIQKIGLSLKDDFMMLHKRADFMPQAIIELQEYVKTFGIQDRSLQKIYAILFDEKISKSQRMSNWEADNLTEAQQKYAALDAWACLKIYNYLQELKQNGNFRIAPAEENKKEIKETE